MCIIRGVLGDAGERTPADFLVSRDEFEMYEFFGSPLKLTSRDIEERSNGCAANRFHVAPTRRTGSTKMTKFIHVYDRDIRIEGRVVRIARPHGDRYRFLDAPAPIIEGIRGSGERVDLFTFAQRLPEREPRFPYMFEWDNFAVLPITTFENWWTKELGFKARNKAKQAEKNGVVLREVPFDDLLVAAIREIYNECPVRQRKRFAHYGKDFETVHREEATFLESSIFIGAFFEDKLIGFVKLVADETGTQAGLMNIISMVKHRDKVPQNALIANAVRACATRGIRYLVYSKFDYGKKGPDGLRDFKERNGFRKFDSPRYYVPLTLMGRAALQMGLHQSMAERMPESVARRFRDLRAAWYERRFPSLTGEI